MIPLRRSRASEADLTIATIDGSIAARIPATIRVELQYLIARLDAHESGIPDVIGVTSALAGEGVSLVSHGLGAVLNLDAGRDVCIVGTNWWGTWDGVDDLGPGTAGVLAGEASLAEAILPTRYPKLSLLPAGDMPPISRVLTGSAEAIGNLLDDLRGEFDNIVVDLPALTSSSVTLAAGAAVDATLLVARQKKTRLDQVDAAVEELRHANLLGIVLNDYSLSMPGFLKHRLLPG